MQKFIPSIAWLSSISSESKSPLFRLNSDVNRYTMSFLSGNEKVDLMYTCLLEKDKYLLVELACLDLLNVQREDTFRYTLLMYVCSRKHLEVCNDMITFLMSLLHRRHINCQSTMLNKSALMVCSREGCTCMVQPLLRAGGDVNILNEQGVSALTYASIFGHTKIALCLIEKGGANVNQQNNAGETALMYASGKGHLEIVLSLLAAGAQPNMRDCWGCTGTCVWNCSDDKLIATS